MSVALPTVRTVRSSAALSRRRRRAAVGSDITATRARTVVYGLLLAFWFTLPWEGVIRLGGTSTIARGAGAVLVVAALAVLAMTGRRTRGGDFLLLLVLFAAWVSLSAFWTLTPGATQQRTVTMVQLVIMVLVTWEFAHTRRRVEGLMAAWVCGCLVIGTIVVLGWLQGQSQARYGAPGTSPGDLAYSLLLGIPMAWHLSLRTTRRWALLAYRFFVPFACLAVLLTASRAALLSTGFALLIIPLTFRGVTARARIAVAAAFLASTAAASYVFTAATGPVARLSTTSEEITSGTLDHRTTLWGIALDLIDAHPVIGLGAGGSRYAVGGEFFTQRGLHNTFLSIGVELGMIGLVLFLLVFVAAVYRAVGATHGLDRTLVIVLSLMFFVSLMPRHDDYVKSTYAILVLIALIGVTFGARPRRRPQYGPAYVATSSASSAPASSAE